MAIALNNLGRILLDEGWKAEAVTWFRLGLEFAPNSIEIRWNLATA